MKRSMSQSFRKNRHISAEWITFAITSFVVLILVSLVLFVWFTQDDQPPVISVTHRAAIQRQQGQYYVPFTVTNTGGGIAESVQVVGELMVNGEVAEMGEQQIDFLSADEEQQGTFIFSQDPERGELMIRVASYKLP